jgi:hypothetical protein
VEYRREKARLNLLAKASMARVAFRLRHGQHYRLEMEGLNIASEPGENRIEEEWSRLLWSLLSPDGRVSPAAPPLRQSTASPIPTAAALVTSWSRLTAS